AAELSEIYQSLWQSCHPARKAARGETAIPFVGATLPSLLAERGYHSTLITDEHQVAALRGATEFQELIQIGDARQSSQPTRAKEVASTDFARIFTAVIETVANCPEAKNSASDRATSHPRMIWVHSQGMFGPWDAPLELQLPLLEEEDTLPIESVVSPDFSFELNDDPDIAFRYGAAYAAQVLALDACLQGVLEALKSRGERESWLVMLIGARGFPLAEHQRIGGVDSRLPTEQLHVPWLIRFPDGRGQLARSESLVSHLDLLPTLLDWIGRGCDSNLQVDGSSLLSQVVAGAPTWRDSLLSTSSTGSYSVRTAGWSLRGDASDSQSADDLPTAELFVRPDDRWEANDVSKLCPDVVEQLHQSAMDALRQLTADNPTLPAIESIDHDSPQA
ncbi:MAG TPA: sulfatase-like hydrolase/transferase, partial [Lacipirellulaceae bacterium]|nr:sulfatase-like hydrolase/transferase [Lacipirellulaceae bacterium]